MPIEFKNVTKNYLLGKVFVPALQEVSFSIQQGDFITLCGPSGSGKSTLLNLLGLIDNPDKGIICFDEEEINFHKQKKLSVIRREKIGFIFQNFNLIPILNVEENIGYPLLNSPLSMKERKSRVTEMLEAVGLDGLGKRFPNELSGGQHQRVAIARAVIRSPALVLADEPTANLDTKTGSIIIDLLHQINEIANATFIMATHDKELISRADSLLKIQDGRLVHD